MPIVTDRYYPSSRPDRDAPVPTSTPGPGAPASSGPGTMVWPFSMRKINGVAVAVSPAIVGPAIVDTLTINYEQVGGATPLAMMQLFASDDNSGEGSGFPAGTTPSGDPLFERLSNVRDDFVVGVDTQGMLQHGVTAGVGYQYLPVRRIVRKTRFFLKLRIAANAANAFSFAGHAVILTGVPASTLANFR